MSRHAANIDCFFLLQIVDFLDPTPFNWLSNYFEGYGVCNSDIVNLASTCRAVRSALSSTLWETLVIREFSAKPTTAYGRRIEELTKVDNVLSNVKCLALVGILPKSIPTTMACIMERRKDSTFFNT